jgi:hypothetical protein
MKPTTLTMLNKNASELDLFSTSDLVSELVRRGYSASGFHDKGDMHKCIKKAINAVNWDNWQDEDTGQPHKLGDVYYCKLDWIKETLDEDDEAYSTIEDIQETICPILNLLDNE